MNLIFKPSYATCSAFLLCLFYHYSLCDGSGNTPLPSPLRFPPSLDWDGNDGSWSSFAVQIGTPPQAVRLLPATGSQSIWAVLPIGCEQWEGSDCPYSRGYLFNYNKSSTWQQEDHYELPLSPEHYLPYSGNADFGFDNITLDWQGHGGVSLKHQVIGGYLTDDLYIGSLGLSPLSVNITSLNDGFPSLLGTLSEKGIIPSESYGYLAGAYYYGYPISTYGNLTFGGYDSTRLDLAKNLTLTGGQTPIDPFSLAFESAFGLVWNETYSLYILDDPQRNALLAKNPNITFTLSTGISDSPDRLNITLPYAAFDLNASYPLAGNDTVHYFPLKQAANDTQYTLGRTFLQEVYMIADYAHGDITLYPAVYPEEFVQSNLVTICPLNSTACVDPRYGTPATQQPTKSTNFPTSAVVGSIIGVLALLGLGIFLALRRRTKKRTRMAELEGSSVALTATAGDKPELADTQKPVNFNELEGPNVQNPEIWKSFSELESGMGSPRQELDGGFDGTFERYEMPAEEISAGNNSIYKGR